MTFSANYGPRKIESRQNARVKELRAGLRRGMKTSQGHIAIEGEHLLLEAVRSGLNVHTIFVRSGSESLLETADACGAEVLILSPEIFASAAATEHAQGIAALIDPPRFESLRTGPLNRPPLLVVAVALQDPGNLGTLVRSAEAFGATGVILLPGTVSLWNAKTLRASAGSAFRLPVWTMAEEEACAALRAQGVRLLAAVARGGIPPANLERDLAGPVALLLGNEGAGLGEAWLARADVRVTIACPGGVESLNAAVAGSILLYEAARQRPARQPGRRPSAPDSVEERR